MSDPDAWGRRASDRRADSFWRLNLGHVLTIVAIGTGWWSSHQAQLQHEEEERATLERQVATLQVNIDDFRGQVQDSLAAMQRAAERNDRQHNEDLRDVRVRLDGLDGRFMRLLEQQTPTPPYAPREERPTAPSLRHGEEITPLYRVGPLDG